MSKTTKAGKSERKMSSSMIDAVDALNRIRSLVIAAQMAAGEIADSKQCDALGTLLDIVDDKMGDLKDILEEMREAQQ